MFYKSLEKPFSGLVFTSNAALSECHWEIYYFRGWCKASQTCLVHN